MGHHSHLRLVVSNYHLEEKKDQTKVIDIAKETVILLAYAAFFPSIYFIGTFLQSVFS